MWLESTQSCLLSIWRLHVFHLSMNCGPSHCRGKDWISRGRLIEDKHLEHFWCWRGPPLKAQVKLHAAGCSTWSSCTQFTSFHLRGIWDQAFLDTGVWRCGFLSGPCLSPSLSSFWKVSSKRDWPWQWRMLQIYAPHPDFFAAVCMTKACFLKAYPLG